MTLSFENLLARLEEESKQSDWDRIDIFVLGTTEKHRNNDLAGLDATIEKFRSNE